MMMKHVCGFGYSIEENVCGTWKTGILKKYMLFFKYHMWIHAKTIKVCF